jgi:hypothetical protein
VPAEIISPVFFLLVAQGFFLKLRKPGSVFAPCSRRDTPGSSLILNPDGDVFTGKKSPYRAPIAGFTLWETP